MFDESYIFLERAKDKFAGNVLDAYGRSVLENTFEPLESNTKHLQNKDSEAQQKMREIKNLLRQARSIR